MKLLIVDDQQDTLRGLVQQINWQNEGIEEVCGAKNVMEARYIFQNDPPDILLCDIEMPVETGIDLAHWVREQGYETQIIFLTCHSDFAYAREALDVHALNYVLQPAPYHRIVEAVRQGMEVIYKQNEERKMLQKARILEGQRLDANVQRWEDYLTGKQPDLSLIGESRFVLNSPIWLILFENASECGEDTICKHYAEVYRKEEFRHLFLHPGKGRFAVLMQRIAEERFPDARMKQYLQYLSDLCELDTGTEITAHYIRCEDLKSLPAGFETLLVSCEQNHGKRSGLFSPAVAKENKPVSVADEMKRWQLYLVSGQADRMEEEARELLFRLVAHGQLGSDVLMMFYQEFMRILYAAGSELNGKRISELFTSAEDMRLYRNSMNSVSDMLSLIHLVAEKYGEDLPKDTDSEVTETIKNYIGTHLSKNIMKEDIVNLVHLNADYVTRIFKKQTGMSIKSYVIQEKMKEAQRLLRNTSLPVSHIAVRLGYSNFSYFSTSYKKVFGIAPAEEERS
ncbi:MAG: response regulator [Erysipelotrichaceae bacterium]|nr:response regulator [Erysipelotrichaceae bacterium]MBR3168072.1 response regulator [Erysipelotrichaceae bacterium]